MSLRDHFQWLLGLSQLGKRMTRGGKFSKKRWTLLHDISDKLFSDTRGRSSGLKKRR